MVQVNRSGCQVWNLEMKCELFVILTYQIAIAVYTYHGWCEVVTVTNISMCEVTHDVYEQT